jgi:hypothetical protein
MVAVAVVVVGVVAAMTAETATARRNPPMATVTKRTGMVPLTVMGDPQTAKGSTNTKFLVIYLSRIRSPLMQTGKNKHLSGIKTSDIQMVTGTVIIWGNSRPLKKFPREIHFRPHRQTSQRILRVQRKVRLRLDRVPFQSLNFFLDKGITVCHLTMLSIAKLYGVGDRRANMEQLWNDNGQAKTEVP